MQDIILIHRAKELNRYLVFSLILVVLIGIHFEGFLAIPADFLRPGARFKIADLLSLTILGIIFFRTLFKGSVNKNYLLFAGAFLLITITSFAGPAENKGYMIFSGVWLFTSFTAAFFLMDYLSKYDNNTLIRLLNNYLVIISLVYAFAFIDYIHIFITRTSLIPESMDFRFHQHYLDRYPRFEGFSVLSLGFISLGYFNFILSVLLRKSVLTLFYLLLIILTISTGGYIAFIIAFTYYLLSRMNISSRALAMLPLLAFGLLMILVLIAQKQAHGAIWSYGVRRDFFLLLPDVLLEDPTGMGFGQSRFLYQFIDRYTIGAFPILYQKLTIEKLVVVESSHLELWYEFGITGILFTLVYTAYVFTVCLKAFLHKNRLAAGLASMLLFFWIHAFFTAAYFYQLKFWVINLLLFLIIKKALRKAGAITQNQVQPKQ
jgi:hypothetical protein